MKYSFLISTIILGIAALFAIPRQQKIKALAAEWTGLKIQADEPGVPGTSLNSGRVHSESIRIAREEKVNGFAAELITFFQKMKAREKSGERDQSKYQSESARIIQTITALNPRELRLLIKAISASGSVDKKHKLELIGFATMMLASDNPEAALAISLKIHESLDTRGRQYEQELQMILTQYAARDPVAAAQWLNDNVNKVGEVPNHVKYGMIGAAARTDIGLAIKIIDTLEMGKEHDAFANISREVKPDNADAFIAALRNSMAGDNQRTSALRALNSSPLFTHFESASRWLQNENLTAGERKIIAGDLRYDSVMDEPEKWLNWLAATDEVAEARTKATANIIAGWTHADFAATGEWINAQPDGEQKNQSIAVYANTLAPHEPAAAAQWAVTLPKGRERDILLQTIHRNYQKKDHEAAAAFATKQGIKTD